MSSSDPNVVPRLVLASGSPRRRELLGKLGLQFEVIVSDLDESIASTDPAFIVKDLASAKALAVAESIKGAADNGSSKSLVLGADTIVVLDDDILGKPQDRAEAVQMLTKLSGRLHQVFTGVSLVELPSGKVSTIYTVTDVHFREIDAREIEAYVDTGEPMDKAGAYALQGIASLFVCKIDGCYTNVIGLPIPDTVQLLRQHGLEVMGMGAKA
ncbi:MAG: Maf family protein [Candidatus Obscuribacterales bacterium]|jgi:septum formation protein|nr:Maf family protein [Candidatus Obscuribacterales bacterium]